MAPGKRRGPAAAPGPTRNDLSVVTSSLPRGRDGKPRLPACMLCVVDHLASGLTVGPRALLIVYGRHAHDGGCGIWLGQRSLKQELQASHDTIRVWRDDLLDRELIERLPRRGPHGADLLRLGPCDRCGRHQRASIQARCGKCQRAGLQHAEDEWGEAQRAYMEARKRRELQGVPARTTRQPRTRAAGPRLVVVERNRPAAQAARSSASNGTRP
jgi:hypothetical protein